jgi:5'-3' exonuclease
MTERPKGLFGRETPILAWDVANLAWRSYHRFKHLTRRDEHPSGHVFGATRTILAMVKKQPENPILWFALEGYSTLRRKIFPGYKANRQKRNFDPTSEIEGLVKLFPGVTFYHPGLEADDLLAMMTNPELRGTKPITLITGDHDLWKFSGKPKVTVWNKDHAVDPIEIAATFGVTTGACVPLIKALFGDESDNLPSASKQTRQQEIRELVEKNRLTNPKQLRSCLSELSVKVRVRLEKDWDTLRRNWQVVKLSTQVDPKVIRQEGPGSPDALVEYLREFECKSLYEEVRRLW